MDLGEPMSTEEYNRSLLANEKRDSTANQLADTGANQQADKAANPAPSDGVINITPLTSILKAATPGGSTGLTPAASGGSTVLNVTPAGLQSLLAMPGSTFDNNVITIPTSKSTGAPQKIGKFIIICPL